MHESHQTKLLPSILCATALVMTSAQAAAQAPTTGDDWRFAASFYNFAPSIKGTTAVGSAIDVRFDTLLDNLNMAFMGAFEARKDRWSVLTDVLYLNVGANGGAEVPVTTPSGDQLGLRVDAGVKVRGWVLSFLGGYRLRDDPSLSLDVIAGTRYLEMKNSFNLELQDRPFGRPIEDAVLVTVWDAVVGLRGRAKLSDNWYLPFYLDVGTGETDLTWQVATGLGYRFHWGDIDVVYRHLEWDFGSSSPLDDLSFSGPQLTATFHF